MKDLTKIAIVGVIVLVAISLLDKKKTIKN
jgi:hypothetical protein